MSEEIAAAAEAYSDAMEKMSSLLESSEMGDTLAKRLENLQQGLRTGTWPGGEAPDFDEKFVKNFTKGGPFNSWIEDLDVETDSAGNMVKPIRFKAVGALAHEPTSYFSADDIKKAMGSTGPQPVLARSPWLLDNDLKFDGKTLTRNELRTLGQGRAILSWGGDSLTADSRLTIGNHTVLPAVQVGESPFYQFKFQDIEAYALGSRSRGIGGSLVDEYFNDGGETVKLRAYNLGNSALNGNDSESVFKALGMVNDDGNIKINEQTVTAKDAADSLDEEAETRYNTGARLEKPGGEFKSSCFPSTEVCCGDAAASRANFSDIGNRLDRGNPSLSQEQRDSAEAVRDAVKNYRSNKITTDHESLESDNLQQRGGMSEADYKKYKTGRDEAFKKQGLDQSSRGRMYRKQAELDKLKKGWINSIRGTNSQEAIEKFEREGWPIGRSVDDFGNITPPPLANDVETLQKLERAFAEMKANKNPLFDGLESENPEEKAAAEKRIEQWRRNNGLGKNTEGWYRPDDPANPEGNWSCNPKNCDVAAPDNAEKQLAKLREDPSTKELAEKVEKKWRWYHYLGYGILAGSLGELLISHAEAMSGCFLVPVTPPGQGQLYLPTYKINPMTCLQRNKTWGSGYFLGMRMGANDWFGSTFLGVTPTSKGGNVQASPMCLRGGKCDKLSFPNQNYFACDNKSSPGGWRTECPNQKCLPGKDHEGLKCPQLSGSPGILACFPDASTPGVSPGGKTYFYDYATRTCTEDLSGTPFGTQYQGDKSMGPQDGCNFVCSNPSPQPSLEYFQTDAPSPCGVGGQNCAVGQTCDKRTNTCVSQYKTCLPVGDDAVAAPGTTLSARQASSGYCRSDDSTHQWTCNTGVEGPLVPCDGENWKGNKVYTNCKIGGVNFATDGNADYIFNGYCSSKEIKSGGAMGNHDGGFFGPFGIGVSQTQFTDTVSPLCFNNPNYINPFDSDDYTTSVNPKAKFSSKTSDGKNHLTCVLPQEYYGNQICTTDSDCSAGEKQQICVGSYGGKVPHKTSLGENDNMNPGYCVNVSPCPANSSPGQCLTDTTGKKYLAECSDVTTKKKLQTCVSDSKKRPNIVAAMCAMPDESDASKAKPGSNLGTRGMCLSIDGGPSPKAKRHHAGFADNRPDPCYDDNADACSNFCNSAGPDGIQVPPGYALSCRNVGLLGAAADWLGQAIGPIDAGGDPFGVITKVLMWIGIALAVGIVVLGILSLFIKRLESAMFGWMG